MHQHYFHLHLPPRGRLYFGVAVWLLVMHTLATAGASSLTIVAICLLLTVSSWFVLSDEPAGMEIVDGQWRFFVGEKRWAIPMTDVMSVRILGSRDRPLGLVLKLRDGRTDILPRALAPRIDPLARELAMRGIPMES